MAMTNRIDAFLRDLPNHVDVTVNGEAIRPLLRDAAASLSEAREQGRREILAEITKLDALYAGKGCDICWFCDASIGVGEPEDKPVPHKPQCLWLRAQQAAPIMVP